MKGQGKTAPGLAEDALRKFIAILLAFFNSETLRGEPLALVPRFLKPETNPAGWVPWQNLPESAKRLIGEDKKKLHNVVRRCKQGRQALGDGGRQGVSGWGSLGLCRSRAGGRSSHGWFVVRRGLYVHDRAICVFRKVQRYVYDKLLTPGEVDREKLRELPQIFEHRQVFSETCGNLEYFVRLRQDNYVVGRMCVFSCVEFLCDIGQFAEKLSRSVMLWLKL